MESQVFLGHRVRFLSLAGDNFNIGWVATTLSADIMRGTFRSMVAAVRGKYRERKKIAANVS